MKEQKSIAAVMEAKKASAIEEVSNLLWQEKPAEKIAGVAIAGGLSAAEVDKVQAFISNARAELSKLEVYDVAKLKADAITAKGAFDKVDAEFNKVRTQRNEAARGTDAATAALREAQQVFIEIADQTERGDLPLERVPELVSQILTRRKAGEKIHASEQRLRELIKLKKDQGDIINQYQKQVDQAGSRRNNVVSTPGGFVSENDMMKQKLDKHTTDQAALEKAIAKLEDEIIAAVKSYEKMPSPFEIPKATEATNG